MTELLKIAGIDLGGVFLNADPGFDAQIFRNVCEQQQIQANIKANPGNSKEETLDYSYFDEELYKRRIVIERANAWLDSFKALLVRFETLVANWISLHLLAFTVLFFRKINRKSKV